RIDRSIGEPPRALRSDRPKQLSASQSGSTPVISAKPVGPIPYAIGAVPGPRPEGGWHRPGGFPGPRCLGSLALGTGPPDLDAARRHLGILLASDEVDLGGADVAVAGKFANLVH